MTFACIKHTLSVVILLFLDAGIEGGYIVTAPNRFIANRNETVCISFYNLDSKVDNQVSFLLSTYVPYWRWSGRMGLGGTVNKTIQSVNVDVRPTKNMRKCVQLKAGELELDGAHQLLLQVKGTQQDSSYQFNDSIILSILPYRNHVITFIQTDRPIYNPGQTVRFRVLRLDSRLRPIADNIQKVVVKDPNGVIMSEWLNSSTQLGLAGFEMPLSTEPPLGRWLVQVTVCDSTSVNYRYCQHSVTFNVSEYVLPKFEVTIQSPEFIAPNTAHIVVSVCAKYTYGMTVKGTAQLTSCLRKGVYEHYLPDTPCLQFSNISLSRRSGCGTVNISRAELEYERNETFHYPLSMVELSSSVVEKGTKVTLNSTVKRIHLYGSDIRLGMDTLRSFKPGIPYTGKVKVRLLDRAPAPGRNVTISFGQNYAFSMNYQKSYMSDSNGEVHFTIPSNLIIGNLPFYLLAEPGEGSIDELAGNGKSSWQRVESWYSPSGKHIQFLPLQDELQCGQEVQLELAYTTTRRQQVTLNVVVVGPSHITNISSHNVTFNTEIKSHTAKANSSSWKLLPSRWFEVDRFGHLRIVVGESKPSASSTPTPPLPTPPPTNSSDEMFYGTVRVGVHITASMSPNSRILVYYVSDDGEVVSDHTDVYITPCMDNVVKVKFDKSIGKPGENVKMSLKASKLSLCAYGVVDQSVYLNGEDIRLSPQGVTNRISYYLPSQYSGYRSQGTHCQSNVAENRYFSSLYYDAKRAFDLAGLAVLSDLTLETRPCISAHSFGHHLRSQPFIKPVSPEVEEALQILHSENLETLPDLQVRIRNYFPETWLWNTVTTDADGHANIETNLPHTITKWVAHSWCINKDDGLGVASPATITTYQPFFLSATLPYSVIRGEEVPISLTVFNYLSLCMPVNISVSPSTDYNMAGISSSTTCVCSNDTVTKQFPVILNRVGSLNITAVARILNMSKGICHQEQSVDAVLVGVEDVIVKTIIVGPEGVPRQYSTSDYVCVETAGSKVTRHLPISLPPSDWLVEDSVTSSISVVGDVIGPALQNTEDLLRIPYGCGEQNIALMAPNILVLKYLEECGRDSTFIRDKAINNMKTGYQRQMNYRHDDSSYSAFGPGRGDRKSVWLTAFVVQSFAQASSYIHIDTDIQKRSIHYIKNRQLSDGCFTQEGMVHNRLMRGVVGTSMDTHVVNMPLTAYILASMLEAGVNASDHWISRTVTCLFMQPIRDNYTLALVTYALSLHDPTHSSTLKMHQTLMAKAEQGSGMRWWRATNKEDISSTDQTESLRPNSDNVETTAYALLATLRLVKEVNKRVTIAFPIVKWLSRQRNAHGGFGSTQDTVVALRALAQFATLIYTGTNSLHISATYLNFVTPFATFDIKDDSSKVAMSVFSPVVVEASGQGCFLVQVDVRYNVRNKMLNNSIFSTVIHDFQSDINPDPCKRRKLQICTRFEGKRSSTNMAVVQVKMVTGWVVDLTPLKRQLVEKVVVIPGLRRYDVEKNNDLQLYFNEIPKTNLCFDLEIQRVVSVKNAKSAFVTVYDYYDRELNTNTEYYLLSVYCRGEEEKTTPNNNTKDDLPAVSYLQYINSLTQARQPTPSIPPWSQKEEVNRCPVCLDSPGLLTVIDNVSQFTKAYKVIWRMKAINPISLLSNLRPTEKVKFGKRFINYKLPPHCPCVSMLQAGKGDKLLILGNWVTDPEVGGVLSLTGDSIVSPLTRELEKKLRKAVRIQTGHRG